MYTCMYMFIYIYVCVWVCVRACVEITPGKGNYVETMFPALSSLK